MNDIKVGDVVFIRDSELQIDKQVNGLENERPCIVLHIDDEYYYVIHMTTKKGNDGDPNVNKVRLDCGSYVTLNSKVSRFDDGFMEYVETVSYDHKDKYAFSDLQFEKIRNAYKNSWE